jgi:hypothetical protein
MGTVKTQATSTTDEQKQTKVCHAAFRISMSGEREGFMMCLQAGDAASVPRLQAMLLLATDTLCVFNKPSGVSVQVTLASLFSWLYCKVV